MRDRARPLRFALALSSCITSAVAAAPAHELIVALRAAPATTAAPRAFARLALTPLRTLGDRLPIATAVRRGSRAVALDPARIVLVAAADSLAAAAALDSLARDPDVAWVEINRVRVVAEAVPDSFPNDPLYRDGRQWGLCNPGPGGPQGGLVGADIHARAAWAMSVGDNRVRLALADTGVDPAQPEFRGTMPDGTPRLHLGINVTADPSPSWADSFGHGTLVAGVMAARTNDGATIGPLGMAGVCGGDGAANLGCQIVPIKIAPGHSGGATSFDIAEAMLYAAGVGARALNLSFSGTGPSRLERLAMLDALLQGCVVVCASGNRGYQHGAEPEYPSAYAADGAGIAVGASDRFDRRATFSSYGPGLDLVAPGHEIWTTWMTYTTPGGATYPGYVENSGTSFAAPFVTGTIGLLAATRPELMDTDFQHVVRESADDIGAPGWDAETAYGRLNAAAALRAVAPEIGILHAEAAATRRESAGFDTLAVGEPGPGTLATVWPPMPAERFAVGATVAIPDSFLDSVRVWPRIAGTTTIGGAFRMPYATPWAEVSTRDARTVTLRGYLYRASDDLGVPMDDGLWLPWPPEQARFGYTMLGRVDRAPTVRVRAPRAGTAAAPGDTLEIAWDANDPDEVSALELRLAPAAGAAILLARFTRGPTPGVLGAARAPLIPSLARVVVPCVSAGAAELVVRALDTHGRQHDEASASVALEIEPGRCDERSAARLELAATPNPFRDATRFAVTAPAWVRIVDVSGRRVRRVWCADAARGARWDGRDDAGRRVAPGLYFVNVEGARAPITKVVRLE